jgi:hypothetical protein
MSTPEGQPTQTPAPASERAPRSSHQKLWVPIVLLIGLIAGEAILFATAGQPPPFGGGSYGFGFHNFPRDPLFQYHVLLTTVEVSLLIALVLIYGKMYVETKANFSLGLVVVLAALLLQALLSYPVVDGLIGTPTIEPGFSSPTADVFTICAYTLFLYLSLE